jgi:DsbC/DsbD-like thiol-disulfide interchange protein
MTPLLTTRHVASFQSADLSAHSKVKLRRRRKKFQHSPFSGIYNRVRDALKLSIAIFLCLAAFVSRESLAQTALPSLGGSSLASHHTQAKLILSAETAKPGDTIWAGVDMKMEPGWHTYWKNPGAAGLPTKIAWQLPSGVTAGEIQWPLPEKLPPIEVTTYGYENEVTLLVPLTLASNLPAGPIHLKANVSWLECKDVCIPASQAVEATLNIGSETKNSADAALIEVWKSKTPQINKSVVSFVWWEKPTTDDTRLLDIDTGPTIPYDSVDFFPDAGDNFEVQPATEFIFDHSALSIDIRLRKTVKKFSGDWPKEISGVIVFQIGDSRTGYKINLPISNTAPPFAKISTPIQSSVAVVPPAPLWQMLLYAFIGGLILNIMPCVLPVIALKILGFVSEARSEPRRVRNLGLIYALGVLASFLTLAAVVIGVKAAGHHASWGMQFGSPVFIVCLTTLVTLVTLNLFGVFEVTPGGQVINAAGQLASRHGAPGAFFNGALATTLATPCTAPILGTALGFAFSQPPATIVLVFLTVGLGLAAPYVLLSCNPAWLKLLPKPGAWMEKFKIAMGFPMLATVMWLSTSQRAITAGAFFGSASFSSSLHSPRGFLANSSSAAANTKPLRIIITLLLLRRLRLRAGKGIGLAQCHAGSRRDGFVEGIVRMAELTGSRGRQKPSRRRGPPANRCWWISPPTGA